MNSKRVYQIVLKLYPSDFRALFASEMLTTFDEAFEELQNQHRFGVVRFALAELIGLVTGAGRERFAKFMTDRSVRGRCLPDLRMMRPPGVPQEVWFAGASGAVRRTGSHACSSDTSPL